MVVPSENVTGELEVRSAALYDFVPLLVVILSVWAPAAIVSISAIRIAYTFFILLSL